MNQNKNAIIILPSLEKDEEEKYISPGIDEDLEIADENIGEEGVKCPICKNHVTTNYQDHDALEKLIFADATDDNYDCKTSTQVNKLPIFFNQIEDMVSVDISV